jgi:hypothetical protein
VTIIEGGAMHVCCHSNARRLLIGASLLLLAAGCGGAEATVSGRVTLDNEPLQRGTVTFVPQDGGTPGYGPIDSEGNYQVPSRGRAGLSPGRYAVTVVARQPSEEPASPLGMPGPGKSLIPPRYSTVERSDLRFTVERGANRIDLSLRSE